MNGEHTCQSQHVGIFHVKGMHSLVRSQGKSPVLGKRVGKLLCFIKHYIFFILFHLKCYNLC
jgi:hypothetical protein